MYRILKEDRKNIDSILGRSKSIAASFIRNVNDIAPGKFVSDIEFQALPAHGYGAEKVLSLFEDTYLGGVNGSSGPRYFGFVTGGSTPASLAGDWLVSAFDQNACGSTDSVAPQMEKQTIDLFKTLFGLDNDYSGAFVSGATMSNFTGLAIARQWAGEQLGIDCSEDGIRNVPITILSGSPHSTILKSLSMLGLGRRWLVHIDLMPDREAILIDELEKALMRSTAPVIVVANAGTVNTVDFDDLEAIGRLKTRYGFWLHVDAAFGGFAAVSDRYAHLMNGINHADSITIDAHKWLNVPYDAAMQFTRHPGLQLKVFRNSAAYLGDPAQSPDYFHYTPESSRRWRALPSWFTLMAYGKEGCREVVERNCDLADKLGRALAASNEFSLVAPVRMNVVCFSFREDTSITAIRTFLDAIRDDGRVYFTPTVYKERPAIRAAISNWQTSEDDIDIAVEALHDVKKTWRLSVQSETDALS
jgi:glutamate/tyrosine decarboxylase-like PLP-dependent enzyme